MCAGRRKLVGRRGVKGQGPWGPLFLALDPKVNKKKLISREIEIEQKLCQEKIYLLYLKVAFNN